eukprot:scaffold41228_cov50-Phaeocystis_antarctica.AAC.1
MFGIWEFAFFAGEYILVILPVKRHNIYGVWPILSPLRRRLTILSRSRNTTRERVEAAGLGSQRQITKKAATAEHKDASVLFPRCRMPQPATGSTCVLYESR